MATDVNAMNMKKSVPSPQTHSHATGFRRFSAITKIFDFVGEVKEEFRRISWTSPSELRMYTKMVVGATFFCGLGLYVVDLSIQTALHLIALLFHFIFG